MKTFPRLIFSCLGVFLFSSSLQAKKHHPAAAPTAAPLATPGSEPAPLPAESAPAVSPDAPPSASLQPFLDTHLSTLLAPLGTSAFAQPEVLTSLKAGYADVLAVAPASHQPALQLAQAVCDAMISAMSERQNAVAALRGAVATRSSEAEQPRGGSEAVTTARDKDAFFSDSQKNAWIQRTAVLRQNVTALYLRERAAERQVGVWSPAPPPVAPAPAAAVPAPVTAAPANASTMATPSVSAPPPGVPEAPSQGWDPVVGQWLLEGRSPITLGADHTIEGGRHGTWNYSCTTNGGRNYELHYPPPKSWTDYVVLSGDGRTLAGKTRNNQPISAYRQ